MNTNLTLLGRTIKISLAPFPIPNSAHNPERVELSTLQCKINLIQPTVQSWPAKADPSVAEKVIILF
jgi:hypothetical protein